MAFNLRTALQILEDTLAFSVLENIRPMIETAPLEQAADAYARVIQGKARFRMVLVTKGSCSKCTACGMTGEIHGALRKERGEEYVIETTAKWK
jgi:hypothetical protein